ncbi:unnamed protein product [Peniophora sp. CBMAI 1063]|nr:unnamed protein product [Peniophora sp. CBMAI 1063]
MDPAVPQPVSSTSPNLDQCARRACGFGSMDDLVTSSLLRTELNSFYQGDHQSAAAVSLLRLLSALDVLLALPSESSGVHAGNMQLLWELLSVEQALTIIHAPSLDVDLMQSFGPDKRLGDMLDGISALRSATGEAQVESLALLESRELGPLQWWLAADVLSSVCVILRKDIYDGVLRLFAKRREQTPLPSFQINSTRVVSRGPSSFDAGSTAEAEARIASTGLSVGLNSSPTMPLVVSDAAVRADRTLRSPWLAPRDFQPEITWRIDDLKQLAEDLFRWPSGQPVPDVLIWEHPEMHGCPVDANGHAAQFQASFVHGLAIGQPFS